MLQRDDLLRLIDEASTALDTLRVTVSDDGRAVPPVIAATAAVTVSKTTSKLQKLNNDVARAAPLPRQPG